MVLKRQDFKLIILFYLIYFGVYHFIYGYLYQSPTYISEKYLLCSCFGGCRL